jgi:hypothetical protein
MSPITIKSSRLKYAFLLLIAIAFVFIGAMMVTRGKATDAWVGWAIIVFFGAGIPLFAWQFYDSRPRLVLNDEGVLDRTLGVGIIPWSQITGATLRSVHGNYFICLEMRNPEQWLERLSPLKRAMVSANEALGFTPLNLNLGAVAADPREIYELVIKKAAASQVRDG